MFPGLSVGTCFIEASTLSFNQLAKWQCINVVGTYSVMDLNRAANSKLAYVMTTYTIYNNPNCSKVRLTSSNLRWWKEFPNRKQKEKSVFAFTFGLWDGFKSSLQEGAGVLNSSRGHPAHSQHLPEQFASGFTLKWADTKVHKRFIYISRFLVKSDLGQSFTKNRHIFTVFTVCWVLFFLPLSVDQRHYQHVYVYNGNNTSTFGGLHCTYGFYYVWKICLCRNLNIFHFSLITKNLFTSHSDYIHPNTWRVAVKL